MPQDKAATLVIVDGAHLDGLEAAGLPRQRMLPRHDRAPATSERDQADVAAGVTAPALCAVSAAESLQACHIRAGTGLTPAAICTPAALSAHAFGLWLETGFNAGGRARVATSSESRCDVAEGAAIYIYSGRFG